MNYNDKMDELVKPPFTRYYLRQPRGAGDGTTGRVAAYLAAHKAVGELPYILTLKPRLVDKVHPQCTSNHYIMFVSIMEKYEEKFEKELFKISLATNNIEIKLKNTIEYLQQSNDEDGWPDEL